MKNLAHFFLAIAIILQTTLCAFAQEDEDLPTFSETATSDPNISAGSNGGTPPVIIDDNDSLGVSDVDDY